MLTRLAAFAALTGAACMPVPLTPTQAIIARGIDDISGRAFIACEVQLNWTYDELNSMCGPPAKTLGRSQGVNGGLCYYYPTIAVTFVGGTGAQGIVVCTSRRQSLDGASEVVDVVFGVNTEP